jgi:hypothetical protein
MVWIDALVSKVTAAGSVQNSLSSRRVLPVYTDQDSHIQTNEVKAPEAVPPEAKYLRLGPEGR